MRVGRKRTYGAQDRSKSRNKKKAKQVYYSKGFSTTLTRPLGNQQKSTFRYCDYKTIDAGAGGTAGVHVFSANGLYDPDITGIGHQPTGFDQVMALFDHYTVVGSKIRAEFVNGDGTYAGVVGIALKDNNTPLADYREYIEAGTSSWSRINSTTPGYANMCAVEKTCSVGKYLGRRNPLDEDDLRGTDASNPSEQAYFHVWVAPTAAIDWSATNVNIVIDYVAILTEPRTAGLS